MMTIASSSRCERGPLLSAPAFDLSLRRNDLWRVELKGGTLPIRCLHGRVWITREGSSEDVLLSAGREFDLNGHGLALVGAVSDAEVRLGQRAA